MHRRWSLCAAALAVAAAAFAAYRPSLRNGFVWDDHIYIEGNPFVCEAGGYKKLLTRSFWTSTEDAIPGAARPIFILSLAADRARWGENPRGYHLTNLLLHAANSALVVPLSLIVLPPPAAVAAALIFAVHPANTEAVELASFRPDLLAAFFLLAALLLHWRWRRQGGLLAAAAGVPACAALYGLGLLSKEMAGTFPALAVLLELAAWPAKEKRRLGLLAAALLAYGTVAAAYLFWRAPRAGYGALDAARAESPAAAAAKAPPPPPAPPAKNPSRDAPPPQTFPPSPPQWAAMYDSRTTKFLTMSGVLGQELRVLALGGPLRVDRAPVVIDSPRRPAAWGLWLALLLAAAAAALAWRKSERAPGAALAWILVAWLPVSNLVKIYNPIAERYLYLLSVGAAWAAAWAIFAAARAFPRRARAWTAAAATAAVAAGFAWRVHRRTPDWLSDQALFGREASLQAGNARVFYNLGVEAQQGGNPASAERYLRQALALNPRYVEAQTNLAGVLSQRGDLSQAAALLRAAVAEKPTNYIPYEALAETLVLQKDHAGALRQFEQAYEASEHKERAPALGLAREAWAAGKDFEQGLAALRGEMARAKSPDLECERLFALISWRLGRTDIAASHAGAAMGGALAEPPTTASYVALGRLLEGAGRRIAAGPIYRRAVKLDAADKEAPYRLGLMYMDQQRCDLAAPFLAKAAGLDPKDPYPAMNLGVCFHHLGRLAQAEQALTQAVALRSDPAFYYNLGDVYADEGRLGEAENALRQAVNLRPDYADAWYNLGVILLRENRKKDAFGAFQETLVLQPDKVPALNNAAALLLQQDHAAEAQDLLGRALRLKPDNPSLHNNLGEAFARQGRWNGAVQEFRAAIDGALKYHDDPGSLARYRNNLDAALARAGGAAPR